MKITTLLLVAAIIMTAAAAMVAPTTSLAAANCTQNATKQCISNIVYWYDSCGAVQSIAQNCNLTGQVCQNAQCITPATPTPTPTPNPTPTPTPSSHYTTACYQNNLYWYNQQGYVQDLYKSCNDHNSCTADSCGVNQCINALKCDGSTCATGSQDYATYCQNNGQNNTGDNQNVASGVAVATFAKLATDSVWTKAVSATSGDSISFLVVVKNTSTMQANNVSVKTDLTSLLTFTGNVTLDNVPSSGNIASGISLGNLGPKQSRMILFTATVQNQSTQPQATVTTTVSTDTANNQDSDLVSLSILTATAQNNPPPTTTNTVANTISNTTAATATFSTGIWDFIKKWYLWIIVTIVLIFLFIIIFRRLSSSV